MDGLLDWLIFGFYCSYDSAKPPYREFAVSLGYEQYTVYVSKYVSSSITLQHLR